MKFNFQGAVSLLLKLSGRLAIKIDNYTGVIKLFIEFEKTP